MSAPAVDPATHIRVNALGVDLNLVVTNPAMAAAVRSAWRDAAVETIGPDAIVVTIGEGPDCDVRATDIATALHQLSPVVTQRVIEARAGDLMLWHAAALADPETGATAVLIAPSGTGKTTASRTLGKRFAYLSDETAGIERSGRVLPYRKPLSILEGRWIKTQVSASSLGLASTERDCHVAAVLLIERSPDHGDRPVVTRLETIDAIAAIAPESSALFRTERPLHRIADVINMAGGAYRVTYQEAETLEPVLEDLLVGAQ